MQTQKDIVKILDRAAGRCGNGASSKQTWFLAGLLVKDAAGDAGKLDREVEDFLLGAALTKGEASALIDRLLTVTA